ncbi:transmembrane protein, putative [Medicago truncatula]|uniref:Transmembrane protein, putative n=1 Tax=Medicago truncatula TaxID=3880 RepID=A0A072V4A0_MEDTR|nr:transmembrane protein, putative [Medicago truncatula]
MDEGHVLCRMAQDTSQYLNDELQFHDNLASVVFVSVLHTIYPILLCLGISLFINNIRSNDHLTNLTNGCFYLKQSLSELTSKYESQSRLHLSHGDLCISKSDKSPLIIIGFVDKTKFHQIN